MLRISALAWRVLPESLEIQREGGQPEFSPCRLCRVASEVWPSLFEEEDAAGLLARARAVRCLRRRPVLPPRRPRRSSSRLAAPLVRFPTLSGLSAVSWCGPCFLHSVLPGQRINQGYSVPDGG
jgi:hypothetical protein